MPRRIQPEVRRFAGGFNNSTSVFGTAGFPLFARPTGGPGPPAGTTPGRIGSVGTHGAVDSFTCDPSDADSTNCWIRPVSGGVLEAYPAPDQIEDALSVDVTQAAHGVDSDGTDRVVIYGDGGAIDKIYTLDPTASATAEGAEINDVVLTANGKVASMVSFNDRICVCNGVDQPIAIDIAAGTSAVINAVPPSVTNASTSLLDVAGEVVGVVKYYISVMTGNPATTESAFSVAFGELDASSGTNTADGGQVTVDLSHADFTKETGTVTTANGAGTTLIDSAATFSTNGVVAGMIVSNTTDGSSGTVSSVDSETQITLAAQLTGGTDNDFDSSDAYIVSSPYRIYRTGDGDDDPRYIATKPGGFTYTDNIPAIERGSAPANHGDQPPAGLIDWVSHRGRLFGIDDSEVYWSDPGTHDSWFTSAEGNRLKVHPDDGDSCTALAVVPEGLLIFKRNHIYLLQGESNETGFRLSTALANVEGTNVGTPHINSLVAVPGGVVFYWRNGMYAYSQGSIVKFSQPVESQWTDPTTAFPTDANVSVGYDPRYGHVYVTYDYTTNTFSSFIFDVHTGQWIGAAQNGAARKYLYWPGDTTNAPEFLSIGSGSPTSNTVHQLVSDAFDAPQVCTEKSRFTPAGAFTGSDPNTLKRWLYMDFFFTAGTAGKNVVITPNIDGTDLSAVTVPLPTLPGRKRVNIGQQGYRMTYEFTSGKDDSEKPWGLYEVVAAFQEMPGRSI